MYAYEIDLTKIAGSGDFLCPRCGIGISPDDDTEEVYSILETKVNARGLEELIVRCKKCESQIHLTGFSLLQDLEKPDGEKTEDTSCYIAHV